MIEKLAFWMHGMRFLFREDNYGSKNGLHKIHSVEYLGALSDHGPRVPSPLPLSFNKAINFVPGTKFIALPKKELHSAGCAKEAVPGTWQPP
jgi:hypothetical protein